MRDTIVDTKDIHMRQPKVAIILLNWNGKDDTLECLNHIRKLDYSNFDVILVDNASKDGSQGSFRKFIPEISLIENEINLGFSGGFNVGIQAAIQKDAKYILCLNNDTVLYKDFLKELVTVGEERQDIGGLCPKEYDYQNRNMIVYAGGRIRFFGGKNRGYGEIDKGQYDQIEETKMLCGAAMMFKTKALQKIGFFDSEYFYNTEDKDLALRLMRQGYKLIYVPKAILWHKRRGATGGKITQLTAYFSARNSILFVKKHGKTHEILSFLIYFFYIHIPFLFLRCSNKKKCLRSIFMALTWHINRSLVLKDEKIVEYMIK